MRSSFADVLPDLLELPVFGLGSVGLSLAGAYIEQFAFVTFEQGNVEITVWVIVMGAAALYLAHNVGTDRVRPKPRDVRAAFVQRSRSLIFGVPASGKEHMSWAVSQHAHATFSCTRSVRWQNLDEKVRHPRWGFPIPLPMVVKPHQEHVSRAVREHVATPLGRVAERVEAEELHGVVL